jgi:hypothetical protein
MESRYLEKRDCSIQITMKIIQDAHYFPLAIGNDYLENESHPLSPSYFSVARFKSYMSV